MSSKRIIVALFILCIMSTASWTPEVSGFNDLLPGNISRTVYDLYIANQPTLSTNTNRIYVTKANSNSINVGDETTDARLANFLLTRAPFGVSGLCHQQDLFVHSWVRPCCRDGRFKCNDLVMIDASNAIMNTIEPEVRIGLAVLILGVVLERVST